MSTQHKKNPRYVTAVGIAVYPHLTKPDTKYNADGVFVTELRLPADSVVKTDKGSAAGTIAEFLDTVNRQAYEDKSQQFHGKKDKKGKAIVITEADAPYRVEEDGSVLPKFKLNASGKTRDGEAFTQAPALFDAKGRPTSPESLWGGSKLKVSFEVVPYCIESTKTAGVSLRLKAVQILELVAGGQGGNGSAFGFGEEEGYESDADAAGFSDSESVGQAESAADDAKFDDEDF